MLEYIPNPIDKDKLEKLRMAAGEGPVLILTHHNPDPDGLASGEAISTLFREVWNIKTRLVYTGIVGRVENQAMLNYLTPDWEQLKILSKLNRYSAIALVDTHPGCGNNNLPEDHLPKIVIDHHLHQCNALEKVEYVDLRTDIGATSTIAFQYLEAAGIKVSPNLATSLFYGLKTDTRGLSRNASKYDERAYFKLLARVDHQLLSKVEQAQLPLVYFQSFQGALQATRVYGKAVITKLKHMHSPDLAAEISDLLIRLEGTKAALCMGEYNGTLNISLRTIPNGGDPAGVIIQKVVNGMGMSGGHMSMAGGQIPLENIDMDLVSIERKVAKKFLQVMGETTKGHTLLDVEE